MASFTSDIVPSENGTRRASNTSFEAWLPSQFTGLHRPRGVDVLSAFDLFFFKLCDANVKSFVNFQNRIQIYGNSLSEHSEPPILIGSRKRSIFHPFAPPISILDSDSKKIITIDSFKGIRCFWESTTEVQILSTTGIIGNIKGTETKTYEIYDSYSQLAFFITPNLAPHEGLQLLILGSERSLLTGAVFERRNGFSLELFKPLAPNLKALLISFTLFIIFSFNTK